MNADYLPLLIAGVCALLLSALVLALILNAKFRSDILGGEGEAKVLGFISVKGVAIVLLCGLFLGGLIYPLSVESKAPRNLNNSEHQQKIDDLLAQLPNEFTAQKTPQQSINKIRQRLQEHQQFQNFFNDLPIPLNFVRFDQANLNLQQLSKTQQKIRQVATQNREFSQQQEQLDKQLKRAEQLKQNLQTENQRLKQATSSTAKQIKELQAQLNQQKNTPKSFLFQVDIIRQDMVKFHPAIDFAWKPEQKQEAAKHVLEVLGNLGYRPKQASDDAAKTARLMLIQYQKAKGILPKEVQKQGLLGRGTFLQFINDYV
ncbi:MAG: hypothetical protein Q9N68_07500, partial [Gammaproteobacteria bacterium]|nr:hypothetical protein [Gammaproteobacteria bacterium]